MRHRKMGRSGKQGNAARDTLLISHAVEDNEFTLWLALQLAKEGYRVWCDLTKLLGGENFWADIEQVLRTRGCKFIYVLSRASNGGAERGFRKELHLADGEARRTGIRDFIVPVAIDDLPSGEYNVYLSLRQSISFFPSWRDGLLLLLKKLSRDRVPKRKQKYNPQNVATWWRSYRSCASGILRQPDKYFSNWFPISKLPSRIYIHTLNESCLENPASTVDVWPAYQEGTRLVTFAPATDFPEGTRFRESNSFVIQDILDRALSVSDEELYQLRLNVVRLLGMSLESRIRQAQLRNYELANGKMCWFFLKPESDDNLKVYFEGIEGKRDWRALTGFATITSKRDKSSTKRYWHFSIQVHAKLKPYVVFHITSHVVFSDDGKTPWVDKKRMHRARRRQCKNWYNDAWRDRLLAAVSSVADEKTTLEIPVSSAEAIIMDCRPMIFESEVSFSVISKKSIEESRVTEELVDEDEEDDDDGKEDGDESLANE